MLYGLVPLYNNGSKIEGFDYGQEVRSEGRTHFHTTAN